MQNKELSRMYTFTCGEIDYALTQFPDGPPIKNAILKNVRYILECAAIGIATGGPPAHSPAEEIRRCAEFDRVPERAAFLERIRAVALAEEAPLAQDERVAHLPQDERTA
jgi:hypothetical protein